MSKPLNLSPYLGKVKNRLAYVGLELEGGWFEPPKDLKLVGDGSVFAGKSKVDVAGLTREHPSFRKGEVNSPPIEPILVPTWIKKFYPDVVDFTCGLHVHMSFQHSHYYEMLTDKSYFDTLVHWLELWGKETKVPESHQFWERLAGKNTYCKKKFHPLSQILATSKSYDHGTPEGRYTFLNYCQRYRGTIECRVLPMFEDASTSIKAVSALINITNASLVAIKKRREKDGDEIILPSALVDEVDYERL